jgi:hypothetical protein
MGLDIYKCRVVKVDESEKQNFHKFILDSDTTNKNKIALFEHFKDFVVEEDIEYYDWEKVFENLGLNYGNFFWTYQRFNDEKQEWEFGFKETGTENEISILDSQCLSVKKKAPVLYVDTVYGFYQRKQMSMEFYSNYYGGCWYVCDSAIPEDEGIRFAFTNELLDIAKLYAEIGSPITHWTLEKDEFVEFNA